MLAFSLTINWHPCLTLGEFLFKPYHLSYWSPLHMTPVHDLISATQLMKLSQLHTCSKFFWKCNFSKHWEAKILLCNGQFDFFCSCWASSPDQPNSVFSTRLTVFKILKVPYLTSQPACLEEEDFKLPF